MSDEIKDKEAAAQQEAPKAAEPKPQENAATAPEAKTSAQAKTERPKKVWPTNCAACNKAFKHKLWYYRNGKYFCNKQCWKKLDAEVKAKAAEAKTKEAESQKAQES